MTDRGRVRPENEDALFLDHAHHFYAVADGLGGLPGGAEASNRIVELIGQTLKRVDAAEERLDLAQLIIGMNRIISKEGLDAHPFTGAGSTLTIGQIVADQLLIAHVGDSAAYHLRSSELTKLTIDHTMEQELVDRHGEAARAHMPMEYPHTLTRCIGQEQELMVDQTRIGIASGDRILLCTDGLNKVLPEERITELLKDGSDPAQICQQLTLAANAAEGSDNITVICILIDATE